MTTKTLTITEEAYNLLARLKRKNESFSILITRLSALKVDLSEFHGVLSKKSAEQLEKNIEQFRKQDKIHETKKIKRISEELR